MQGERHATSTISEAAIFAFRLGAAVVGDDGLFAESCRAERCQCEVTGNSATVGDSCTD